MNSVLFWLSASLIPLMAALLTSVVTFTITDKGAGTKRALEKFLYILPTLYREKFGSQIIYDFRDAWADTWNNEGAEACIVLLARTLLSVFWWGIELHYKSLKQRVLKKSKSSEPSLKVAQVNQEAIDQKLSEPSMRIAQINQEAIDQKPSERFIWTSQEIEQLIRLRKKYGEQSEK